MISWLQRVILADSERAQHSEHMKTDLFFYVTIVIQNTEILDDLAVNSAYWHYTEAYLCIPLWGVP